jgi:hypothetical protein
MPRLQQSSVKAAIVVALASCALVASAAHAPRAAAATPCWKVLLNDWYDGRIDHIYPVHCYREAISHLPSDVSTYSSAHDDILRALQSAIASEQKAHKKVSANTPVPPENKPPSSGSGGGDTNSPSGGGGSSEPGRDTGGGLASEVSSSSPSSVPTPLIVLGALALVLVAAGGAGLLAKRIQARRQGP